MGEERGRSEGKGEGREGRGERTEDRGEREGEAGEGRGGDYVQDLMF